MTPKPKPFKFPMSKNELLCGIIFLPIFIVPLRTLVLLILESVDPNISDQRYSMIFFLISFVIVFLIFRKFLKESFSDFLDGKFLSFSSILTGYIGFYLITYLVSILSFGLNAGPNPNDEALFKQVKLNPNVMIAISVLLGPIVEETLFRGVVFGSIRRKNRLLAYLISFLLFSAYHLWEYVIAGFNGGSFDFGVLINLLDYLPASLALAWSYEKSGSVWSPILLHALINVLSITAVLG